MPLLDGSHPHSSFWRLTNGNFLHMCALEWCKLFAEPRKGEYFWDQVVSDIEGFETWLHFQLTMTAAEFDAFAEAMRGYRDNFIAHLDSDLVMDIPPLSAAQLSVWVYHEYIVQHEARAGQLAGLADTRYALESGYEQSVEEAEQVYGVLSPPP